MNKIKLTNVVCLILYLIIFLVGCSKNQSKEQDTLYPGVSPEQKNELNDETAPNGNDDTETEIVYYVNLVEETIAYEKFFGMYLGSGVEGVRSTDFYMNKETGEIFFCPEGSNKDFELSTLNHYDKHDIEIANLTDKSLLEWLGSAVVNYDVDAYYSLPELSQADQEVLDEVCDYLYEELELALNEFAFDVYLGDFYRGHDDREYIMVYLAIVGDRRYLKYVELTKQQEGYEIWLYPPLFRDPGKTALANEYEADEDSINNIVSLNYLIRRVEK